MENTTNGNPNGGELPAQEPQLGSQDAYCQTCSRSNDSLSAARIRTDEHWEVVRAQLMPMFIRRATLIEIAESFRVSVNTAGAWRARLVDDLRKEAGTMQPRDYIMESISSLRLARAEAWRAVLESDDPKDHRAGLHLVAAVENQSTKLGTMIGLFGRAGESPLQAAASDYIDDEARQLRSIALELLSDEHRDNEIIDDQ